ncbi:MAG: hypothetical protein ABH872_07290 [Candidatus Omnitrophota bacterium]
MSVNTPALALSICSALAIIIFVSAYLRTVLRYSALLESVASLIEGKVTAGIFYSSIHLTGSYKGRKIKCSLEQLKEGSNAFLLKAKPHKFPLMKKSLGNQPYVFGDAILYEGWVMTNYFLSPNTFTRNSFLSVLEELSTICEKVERRSITASVEYKGDTPHI